MKTFYNKFIPKEQYERFGVVAVHFSPFEDMEYVWENENIEEAYEDLKQYAHSTIYEGFRYFFKDLKYLKNFCELAENGILKELKEQQ